VSVGELNRTDRFVNTLLLVLMTLLGVSGVIMLYGAWLPWLFDLHRMAGFAVVALLPWKGLTIYRSYLRGMARSFDRSLVLFISLFLAHLLILVIILGIMWMFRWGPYASLFFQTIIAWHWIIGLALLPVLALHAWRRWPSPRVEDFSGRKDFLRLIGLAAVGVFGGGLASRLALGQATPESPRRFTASRGFGMFTGNDFPLTGETAIFLNEHDWRLKVSGASRQPAELTYAQLLALDPQTKTEVIDCTSGWYSVQDWSGFPLLAVLEQTGPVEGIAGVRLVSETGYNHTYPVIEARQILLATHVSGEVLSPQHGFPVRAVVPGRRGWFWVKWLVEIVVLDDPLEVVGGMLWSPRQVLRQF